MSLKQGPFTKDTIANRDAIQRSCFPTFDIFERISVPFRYRVKGQRLGNEMDTSSLETKYRCAVKRDGVSATRGYPETGHPNLTKRSIGVTQKVI